MSLTELIKSAGGDHMVKVQNLHEAATNYQLRKNGSCAITFLTKEFHPNECFGNEKNVALVLWIPRDKLKNQEISDAN